MNHDIWNTCAVPFNLHGFADATRFSVVVKLGSAKKDGYGNMREIKKISKGESNVLTHFPPLTQAEEREKA